MIQEATTTTGNLAGNLGDLNNPTIHATIFGEAVTDLPKDLYIPPEALRVFLETFEGPLDLLLYLIKKQNIDILDIPIAEITRQYMKYVELMHEMQIELAAEYLVMAAMLAEIKSRLLLPRPTSDDDEEGVDPRAELIRRLQIYEQFKKAAENLDTLPRLERDMYISYAMTPKTNFERPQPEVSLTEIMRAFKAVMERAKLYTEHQIEREVLSIRERMSIILAAVKADTFIEFAAFFQLEEGRMGVVVTLIAILELTRQSMIELVQNEVFAPIYVKARQ